MNAHDWNVAYPIGTPVRFYPLRGDDKYEQTKTRSIAWTLGSDDPVVAVEGRAGGVSLEHIVVGDGLPPWAIKGGAA